MSDAFDFPEMENPTERSQHMHSEEESREGDSVSSLDDTAPIRTNQQKGSPSQKEEKFPPINTSTSPGQGGMNQEITRSTNLGSTQPTSPPRTAWASQVPPTPPYGTQIIVSSKQPPSNLRKRLGCLLRASLAGLFLIVMVALCGITIGFYQYYSIASSLPDISDLRNRASQFETTRIYDRNGNVLYEILDPNAGRRTYVTLDQISPYLVAATVATEDKGFYSHPGFDTFAIVRAFLQNYQSGETVSGASTITQQLARTLLFSPEERYEQSYQRKIREAILAAEITRRYSKEEILELYLNENNYGNLAYGIEAAAETYFGTSADKLTLSQASFLAGLPQAPAVYDIYTNPEVVYNRHEDVLVLMYETSQEQGCIYVSNHPQRICLDPVALTNAANEIKQYPFDSPDIQIRYPHWVNYVRSLLEEQYDPQTIYRAGFHVYTTIDPGLQEAAQDAVQEHIEKLAGQNAGSGALVAIRPNTGEILAMVGSADYLNEEISGQINMAVSPRQPGSALKPLTYIAAFEKGWTPATLLWDVPSEFPPSGRSDDRRAPFIPVNFDGRYHGPVTIRSALANSYNVPAVKALDFVGIYEDPDRQGTGGLISLAERVGITTLTRSDYGLSLTLGGGEVTLLELTGFYATLANNGKRIPPVAITRILDHNGNLVYEYQPPLWEQVIRGEHSYLISSILSDNQARTPAFGRNSVLNLPFDAAVKTGTTDDFRDSLTLGYTPDIAVGVWVGNADYTPMQNVSGMTGAAPIWAQVMNVAVQQVTGGNPTPFTRPGGIIEEIICEISGTLPSKWCPKQRTELFTADQPPLPKEEDLWQKVVIDTWTELRASDACPDFTDETFALNVTEEWAKKWIKKDPQGASWAEDIGFSKPVTFSPSRECRSDDPRPKMGITSPRENDTVRDNPLEIFGFADATDWFDFVRIEFGIGEDPVEWQRLVQGQERLNRPELLYTWDLDRVPDGIITLRLYMHSTEDTYAEILLQLELKVPTPTPTPTKTPTPTFTPTYTPTPTRTPLPTNTPLPTSSPTSSSTPTQTLTPSPTYTQTPTPPTILVLSED
jgi:penicillin-binding protein 1C